MYVLAGRHRPRALPHALQGLHSMTRHSPTPLGAAPLHRSFKQYLAAAAQGRTYIDYASGIALGRASASRPWLRHVANALGMKPHAMGLWAANRVLVRPAAA